MKNRVFLLIALLLICVLIPLQRATAKITMKVVGSSTIQTFIDGTDDVTFTIEIISGATDVYGTAPIEVFVDGGGQVFPGGSKYYRLTANPQYIQINGAGTQRVQLTLDRSDITRVEEIEVDVLLVDGPDTIAVFSDTIINVRRASDIALDVEENDGTQNINRVSDVTFTLKITNRQNENVKVNLTLPTSGAVSGSNSINIDTTKVKLSSTSVTVAASKSEKVTITVPSSLMSVPGSLRSDGSRGSPQLKLGSYFFKVVVTPEGGSATNAETADFRINAISSVVTLSTTTLEVLDTHTQTTLLEDIGDISYTLRITNTGTLVEDIYFAISGDIGTARTNPKSIVLLPDDIREITLIIPREALSDVGTYNVTVSALSEYDQTLGGFVVTNTVVLGQTGSSQQTQTGQKQSGSTQTGQKQSGSTQTGQKQSGSTQSGSTPLEQVTHKVILSEFMLETGGGKVSLPRWIEIYNNSSSVVNLSGWKLHWSSLLPSPLDLTITFSEDFRIPPQQARLIVTTLGRHSGGNNLSDDDVYQLPILDSAAGGGFSIKLTNSQDTLVDHIGTLAGDKKTWQLPETLIEGVRSSMIRRFDEGVPRSGTEKRGWRLASDAKRLVAGIYYGSPHDLGTPGYRRGKALPVELSQFQAKSVKNEVVISWTTESELDNAGFNIFRSTSRTQDFRRINTKLIQGAGTTGQRSTYQFIDKTAKPDVAYFYRLEDIDLSGTRGILTTYRLRGVITPTGKDITTWGTLKGNR